MEPVHSDASGEDAEYAKIVEESEKIPEESEQDKNLEQHVRSAAAKKYSQEEITAIIKMGKVMASKAVLMMLISVIEEGPGRGLSDEECKTLVRLVKQRMTYDYCGFLQCDFDETEYKLNISLTLAEKDYVADISVPDVKYAKDLYDKYNFLKSIAIAYWTQFTEDHNALFKRICAYRADINFAELVVDPKSPTTLYFDQDSKKRVGILPYWVDAQGRALRKK